MPVFRYRAVNAKGDILQGSETASTRGEMLHRLRQRQCFPVSLEEVIDNDIKKLTTLGRIGVKQIAVFSRQFSTMLNAGVTIVKCLDILRQQTEHRKFREIISELYEDVQKGFTLSGALIKHRDIFPGLMIHMVEAGEASGSLDTILVRVANHYEKEAKITNRIKSAMVYPALLTIVCVLVVVFLLTFVMPTFIGMFEESGVALPSMTKVLLIISSTLRRYWYVFVFVTGLIVYLFRRYSGTKDGRLTVDGWKLKMPVIKGLTKKVVSARFTRTMSTLLASGVSLLEAMENSAGAVGNTVVAESIMAAREDVRKGIALSVPIRKMGHFPPMVDNMIKIGEEAGTLDDILEKTANIYDEEVETEVQRMLSLLEPLMIIFMAVIVGFIVIAMMLPMFDMLKTVQ